MRNQFTSKKYNTLSKCFGIATIFICFILIMIFFHSHQSHIFFKTVRSFGFLGVVLSILVLAICNMFPIPVEFLTINLMKIYGVNFGCIYSCAGSILGAIFAYFAARFISEYFLHRIDHSHLNHVRMWIRKNETVGLLVVRFIPLVPYELVNYIAGILRLNLFTFIWTTTIGVIPYQIAVAGMYSGVFGGHIKRGILGITLFILLALIGWVYKSTHQQEPSMS
jgi:uncharacterized membrane protein YdjX (TVP38/TMEM64 family)